MISDKNSVFEKLNRKLTTEESVNIFLYLIVLVMPFIIFVSDGDVYHRVGKVPMIYMVSIILLVILFKERCKYNSIEEKVAIIFILTIFSSSFFSPYKKIAFFGSHSRQEGFLMIASYIVLFICSLKYLRIDRRLITICLLVANVMAIYSIMQFYSVDLIRGMFGNGYIGEGVLGTIGNRNFLSTYLLIFLFITFGLYIFYGLKRYYLLSLPLFAAMLCSQTRGGWIAFIVYSLIGLISIVKRKTCLLRSLIIFVSYFLIFVTLNVTSGGKILSRVDSLVLDISTTLNVVTEKDRYEVLNKIDKLGSSRGEIWRITLDLYKDSPIMGTGPDTFAIRLYNDKPEAMESYVKRSGAYIDKAHNEFLEYAMNCGTFTLVAYLALLFIIFRKVWKKKEDDLYKVMLLFIIGYLVQSFFNISVISVAPIFWICLGGIVKIYNGNNMIQIKKEVIE